MIHVKNWHDNEGDWQFLTGNQKEEDAMIICLEDILKSDPSLVDLFDLDYDESAVRKTLNDDWERAFDNE